MIPITSEIPIPTKRRGGARSKKTPPKYPLAELKPGESFWVKTTAGSIHSLCTRFGQKNNCKFITRSESEDGRANNSVAKSLRGTRVWRVE